MKEIKQNSLYAWLLAARPKTLTGAIIPVLIGTSLAFSDGQFQMIPALLCLLFACGMQIAANFINDLFDYLKGSDREDRLGPERACAQGWITPDAMKWGIGITIILSCIIGLGILNQSWGRLPHGGWELIVLGMFCVIFAFLYTAILSYQGWGDLLVLVFFGFISGLVIDTLLVVNNYRDRKQDALSGKRTLIVRFGERFGRYFYLWLGIIATLLCFWFVHTSSLTLTEFIWAPCVYLSLHILTWRKMVRIRSGKKLNRILGETSRNMLLLGLLLAVALSS